ncbi:MAG: DNA-binding Xre family transcriptional regulator [Flavobacteriales bacterium]|jgi:DNA-binding Xre family transcriptional regulator
MNNAVNAEICSALKLALKSRKMSYRSLAEKIEVSEKTIKRLFRDQDCNLSRLASICEAIELSLYELLDFARHYREPLARLSNKQEQFLETKPQHFAFLFFLIAGNDLERIQSCYNLNDDSIFKYLRDLDKQGFIELAENNKFRLLIGGKLLMRLHGPMHSILKEANTLFLNHVMDNDGRDNASFNGAYRKMSLDTLKALNSELNQVSEKYRKMAYQNELILPQESLIPVKWTTMTAHFDVCGIWKLEEHPESFELRNTQKAQLRLTR